MECESAQDLSHEVCGVITSVEQRCVRAVSVHVRHASVVRAMSTSSLVSCLVSCLLCTRRSSFTCDAVVRRTLRSHSFSP